MDIRKRAVIKGFRKGKAPLPLIKARYGEEVKADVAEELISDSYPEAVKEHRLNVASRPTVTDLAFNDDGTFRYTATVEVMPEVDEVKYDDLHVTDIPVKVTDKDVDEMAKVTQNMFAELKPVERPVTPDDVVTVDLKKVSDPQLIMEEDLIENVEIDLTRTYTVKEFKEQLPGMKVGEQKEITVRYDKNYPDPAFAGVEITYLCTVKGIKERILPEFDDAFAKRTGRAETALELKMKLREDLEKEQKKEIRSLHVGQIIKQICDANPIDLPESLVNEYLETIVKEEKKKHPNLSEEEIRSRSREAAVDTIRWNFLYHRIAELEKIEVSPADTENVVKEIAKEYKVTYEQAKKDLESTGRIASIKDAMLEEKVLDFLIGKAKLVPLKNMEAKTKENTDAPH